MSCYRACSEQYVSYEENIAGDGIDAFILSHKETKTYTFRKMVFFSSTQKALTCHSSTAWIPLVLLKASHSSE